MANLVAAGMTSLGTFLELADADSNWVEEAYTIVADWKISTKTDAPRVIDIADSAPDKTSLEDLNIRAVAGNTVVSFFDVIRSYEGQLDIPSIIKKMSVNDYQGLE